MTDAVKSAERVLLLIDLLADNPQGLPYTEIVARLSLPKSSAHGLLATAVAFGYVCLDPDTRQYRLGVRAFEAGQAYLAAQDLVGAATRHLARVRDQVNETCQLAILDGVHNVYLAKAEASHALRLQSRVGARLPAQATGLGKVLLAALSDEEVRLRFASVPLEAYTPSTITDLGSLVGELARIRVRGYATDDGEYTQGVACVAVPIHDHTGAVCAAISVSAPAVRRSRRWQRETHAVLVQAAGRLSDELGYRGSA